LIANIFDWINVLTLELVKYSTGLLIGFSVALLTLISGQAMARSQRASDRSFMDEPPALMKAVWPLILLFAFALERMVPDWVLQKIDQRLKFFGAVFVLKAHEFLGAFLTFPLLFVGAVWVVSVTGPEPVEVEIFWFMGLLGVALPEFWLRDLRRKRDRQIVRSLPTYLEYLSMCVDAGLNFSGALRQAVDKGPRGAMRNEFRIILRDLRAGFPRDKALQRMSERIQLRDITTFVSAVVQAEKMGASIRDTLRIQAEQRLNERFQRAEKMAMEAPVKLVVPLVLFIFPLTFIMLLFPIAIRFIEEGSLF